MSYTALYRKFRPLKFSEMVGQEHITETLKKQVIADRVGHAYLFSGSRGTGKTSAAKILARVVNCLNPKNGEPCNECEMCKAMLSGSLTDIVEMDAASNNSVEDIRAIRDEVNFLPTHAKYRVYIIDEVHMLSTGAFNALLKTLEEPPTHVKFILATTEPQKLPATILSRCQRFDFKRISNDDIIKRLKVICKSSDIKITDDALEIIAVLAEGSMRDSISILERCKGKEENEITDDTVRDLVGIPKAVQVHAITDAILDFNVEGVISNINDVINQGKDIDNFLWEIIKYIKDILVYKSTGKLEIYNQEEKNKIDELAKKVSKERLLNLIYELSELANTIKWATQKTIMFEAGMIKVSTQKEKVVDKSSDIENASVKISNDKVENKKKVEVINVNNPPQVKIDLNSKEQAKIILSDMPQEKVELSDIPQTKIELSDMPQEKLDLNNSLQNNLKTNNVLEEESDLTDLSQVKLSDVVKSSVDTVDKSKTKSVNVPYWNNVIDKIKQNGKMSIYVNLLGSKAVQVSDKMIEVLLAHNASFGKEMLETHKNKVELEKIASIEAGKEIHVRFVNMDEKKN